MTNLCLIIRNVYDAHKVILVFLELVCVEEVHHELGDEGDCDQAEDHGHRPEREQLGAERTPVPLSSILELQEEQINIMKTGKYGFLRLQTQYLRLRLYESDFNALDCSLITL